MTSFLFAPSEYAGTRIAMHDALQRYYATSELPADDQGKIAYLQTLVMDACRDNALLGDRRDIVGKSWAHLLATRDPRAVMDFVHDPEVIQYSRPTSPTLREQAPTLNFWKAMKQLYKARNFAFEEIAQRTGVIDYINGETLSSSLQAAEQELIQAGEAAITRRPEHKAYVADINAAFNSRNGKVTASDLGYVPGTQAHRLMESGAAGYSR